MMKIELIKEYCDHRKLKRPNTNFFHILISLLFFFLISIFYLVIIHLLNFIGGELKIYFHMYAGIIYLILAYIWIKRTLILSIQCYQHFASEDLRRSCVCVPSCSEYSIIALTRYNLIKALCLIIKRLTKGCKNEYKIDYPS